jgi:hypothetical protein
MDFGHLDEGGSGVEFDRSHWSEKMPSVPDDSDFASSTIEELLGQIRDGLRAEEELIDRYGELYAQKASTPQRVLSAIHRKAAEEAGLDIVSLVGLLLAERRHEIESSLEDFTTPERFEAAVERRVRREIWKTSKRNRRGPAVGDPRIDQAEEKGYRPASNGDPRSTVLFETWNDRLESAIRRVRGKNDDQRMLYEVLARLHVLKGWEYGKLARLVYGPGLEPQELEKAADRIRKWIQEPVRHIRAERERNQAKSKKKRGRAAGDGAEGGPANDDSTGDDRA